MLGGPFGALLQRASLQLASLHHNLLQFASPGAFHGGQVALARLDECRPRVPGLALHVVRPVQRPWHPEPALGRIQAALPSRAGEERDRAW